MREKAAITLTINGRDHPISVEARRTLADAIREDCGQTGTHIGCEHGICGACTVIVDGKLVNSCLMLVGQVDGRDVLTIEGLATSDRLHPIQKAFEDKGSLQCGFCGPGVIMSAKWLLDQNPNPSVSDIRDVLSGNLCRCTGYSKMIEAIQTIARDAARQ